MYKTITESDFRDAFKNYGRSDNFSYEGLSALFEYLESAEIDEKESELDVIAICCDFTEYENLAELQENYQDIESMDNLEQNTSVIELDGSDGFIIQNY